jgi:FKBP-type peptidyl-prolyl cis-trans isomerase
MSFFTKIVLIAASIIFLSGCKDSMIEENRVANELAIEKFLTSNSIPYNKHNGVYFSILRNGYGYQVMPGDSVAFWYVGRTLKGNIFDTNIREIALDEGIDQTSREFNPIEIVAGNDNLLQGLSLGIPLCREGQWNSLYFASTLGYGDIQAGTVEPWSPLAFDVFIIYVKNEKIVLEQNNINNFVAGSQGFTPDTTGMWTKYITQGSIYEAPLPNDTIYGWYSLSTLDLNPIDEIDGKNEEIVLNNQLIEGLLLGFMKLKPGEEMQMIIPSPLGFGVVGTEDIEPYTPLYCEIKLDSIK